jgi:hypothetical protein
MSFEIDSCICGQLTFGKSEKAVHLTKVVILTNDIGTNILLH